MRRTPSIGSRESKRSRSATSARAGTSARAAGALLLTRLVLACLLAVPSAGQAASHLWRFSEFYSSPDGKIQFIEMVETGGSPDETRIGGHWYKTDTYNLDMSELLGSDLVGNTANKRFLVGSPSYAALPGVPAPDYLIPDGAIDVSGDTVVWWFYETIVIPPGTIPTDGVQSAVVVSPGALPQTFGVAVNSPTNFAGETGTVVLPPPVPILGSTARALLFASLGLLAALLWWRPARTHSDGG